MQRERNTRIGQTVRFVHFSLLLMICPALGCSGSKPNNAPAKGVAKTAIKVSCPQGQAADILKRFAPSFQAATEIAVQIKTRTPEEPADAEADLWVIEPAEMPRWAAPDKLLPVPDDLRVRVRICLEFSPAGLSVEAFGLGQGGFCGPFGG